MTESGIEYWGERDWLLPLTSKFGHTDKARYRGLKQVRNSWLELAEKEGRLKGGVHEKCTVVVRACKGAFSCPYDNQKSILAPAPPPA